MAETTISLRIYQHVMYEILFIPEFEVVIADSAVVDLKKGEKEESRW